MLFFCRYHFFFIIFLSVKILTAGNYVVDIKNTKSCEWMLSVFDSRMAGRMLTFIYNHWLDFETYCVRVSCGLKIY